EQVITERAVRQFRDAAELALSRRQHWTEPVFPCDSTGDFNDPCVDTFIDTFVRRAFRRPVSSAERDWLLAIYAATKGQMTFDESLGVLLQVVLQAPAFLYMYEAGDADEVHIDRKLNDYELATRLSFFLWNTTPDDALLDAAARGELSGDKLSQHAARLLDDPRAEKTILRFMSQWLQLDGGRLHHPLEQTEKDPDLYPEFDAALVAAMRTETEAFIKRIYSEHDGSFEALFTNNEAYVNGPLAALYGVEGPADPNTFKWVTLDATQRSGLLTRAAFQTVLSTRTVQAPIRRGVWVLEEALCNQLGEPPPNASDVPVVGGSVDTGNGTEVRSVRQDVQARTTEGICANCHGLINPVGFSFEHYDALGRWQTNEATSKQPINASGELKASDVDAPVNGAVELSALLAQSEKVKRCFAKHWFGDVFGNVTVAIDKCSVETVGERFRATGSMRELMLAIIESNAFRYLNVEEETP
ncbi:MAG TPA: DUF1592 domain-containing protein, partial [Sorangium sp.]|nr:DUF1592 domain-containing protein [Sorangium sp.]